MTTPFPFNSDNINDYITTDEANLTRATPFYILLSQDCSIALLDRLLRKGANINKGRIKNEVYQDQPPLSAAIEEGKGEEILLYLIEKGADINYVENSIWRTPLDYLNENNTYYPIVKKGSCKCFWIKEREHILSCRRKKINIIRLLILTPLLHSYVNLLVYL